MKKDVFENSIYQFMITFSNIVVASILWVFTSIPIVTAGVSTAALYHTVVKVVRKDTGSIYREYFRAFRINFRQGLFAGVLFSLYGIVMIVDCYNDWQGDAYYTLSTGVWFVVFILLMLLAAYLFPVISRFENKFLALLYLSVQMAVKNLKKTILILFMMICGMIAIWIFFPIFIFIPGILTYAVSFLIEPILEKHMANY